MKTTEIKVGQRVAWMRSNGHKREACSGTVVELWENGWVKVRLESTESRRLAKQIGTFFAAPLEDLQAA